jgi:hypothetical protein
LPGPSTPAIEFLAGWRLEQHGAIERGGRLQIKYEQERLPHCFRMFRGAEFGDITAHVRFHPRGEISSGSVSAPVRDKEDPPGMTVGHKPIPFELSVPSDATQAEIWFHNFSQTTSRCDAWDSRFGENYWFQIGGMPPKTLESPVSYRTGAWTRPDVVNVFDQKVTKVNAFRGTSGSDLQTRLELVAWVNETTYGANAWIDFHVFDGNDALIHAETLTLPYTGFGSSFRYGFSGKVYQGSTATPGSVQPRPEARKLQYRLYYDINYEVFTDGILHQHELQEDAVTR